MSVVLVVLLVLIAAFGAKLKVRELDARYGDRWTNDDGAVERETVEVGPFRSTSVPQIRQGFSRRIRVRFGLALSVAAVVGGLSLWSAIANYHALGEEPDLRGVLHSRAHSIVAEREARRFWMIAQGMLVLGALCVPALVTRLAARDLPRGTRS